MKKRIFSITLISILILFMFYIPVEAKFINSFIVRIGGSALGSGDEVKLAKHDIIFCNRFHYDDIGGDTWGAIKAINPNAKIYLYTDVNHVRASDDRRPIVSLNNIGRFNISREHTMGNLSVDNPDLFLLDENAGRIELISEIDFYLLDFGGSKYQSYAVEAALNDLVSQPWAADGVYSDHNWSVKTGGVSAWPVKYPSVSSWSAAMNSMINTMAENLGQVNIDYSSNRGNSFSTEGYEAWKALDKLLTNSDYIALEEAAIAVQYGNEAWDIQFYPEWRWKLEVDLLNEIQNYSLAYLSSTRLQETSDSGYDNHGKFFTFWDGLYYALGSYLLGKNDLLNNSYFSFFYGKSYSNVDVYYDEYGKIDLGKSISSYKITNINGNNIYWREFEKGYVYVNPTRYDVGTILLPEASKRITHNNLLQDLKTLPDIENFRLESHRAAIFYKSKYSDFILPPKNLRFAQFN